MIRKLTRADATAMKESVLRDQTKRGRKRMASEFVRDVFTHITRDRCTDPQFCARLAIRTWLEVNRDNHKGTEPERSA